MNLSNNINQFSYTQLVLSKYKRKLAPNWYWSNFPMKRENEEKLTIIKIQNEILLFAKHRTKIICS